MKKLKAALWVEVLKVRRTKIFLISVCFFIFIGIMMGLLMFISMHPGNRKPLIDNQHENLFPGRIRLGCPLRPADPACS